jgi:hypothetical protein
MRKVSYIVFIFNMTEDFLKKTFEERSKNLLNQTNLREYESSKKFGNTFDTFLDYEAKTKSDV